LNRIQEDERRFADDAALTHGRLLHLMGLTGQVTNLVFKTVATNEPVKGSVDDLEKRAMAARPELRASELSVESAAKAAHLAKFEWLTVSGILDANKTPGGMDLGPGAAITIPIFHQNQAGKTRARAEVERAAWNLIGARQQVMFDVRQAHARWKQATEALGRWQSGVVLSLTDLAASSQKAYELGEMSPLAAQENARQLLTARMRAAELRAEQARALADLQRAVGAQLEPSQ
jgi:outer membrane protein TolC